MFKMYNFELKKWYWTVGMLNRTRLIPNSVKRYDHSLNYNNFHIIKFDIILIYVISFVIESLKDEKLIEFNIKVTVLNKFIINW